VGLDRVAARFDRDRLFAGLKLEGCEGSVRLPVGEHRLDRGREPVAPDCIAGLLLHHQRQAPAGQVVEHGAELLAAGGEAEEVVVMAPGRVLTCDDAGLLELAQPLSEQVGSDRRQSRVQVGGAARSAFDELADGQQRPTVPAYVKRFCD
jgi:hypothetical protein